MQEGGEFAPRTHLKFRTRSRQNLESLLVTPPNLELLVRDLSFTILLLLSINPFSPFLRLVLPISCKRSLSFDNYS
jgi:hypothetical protein